MEEVALTTYDLDPHRGCEPVHSREGGSGRALPTETKVESGTSRTKSGTSADLSNGGKVEPL